MIHLDSIAVVADSCGKSKNKAGVLDGIIHKI